MRRAGDIRIRIGKLSERFLTKFVNPFLSPFFFGSFQFFFELVERARLPNCRILLTRHDFVTPPRPGAGLGVPAIAPLGVLHVRQYVNELFVLVGRRESNPCTLRRTDTQHTGSFCRLLYR